MSVLASCINAMDEDINISPWGIGSKIVLKPGQAIQILVLVIAGYAFWNESKQTKEAVAEMKAGEAARLDSFSRQNDRIMLMEERLRAFREKYEEDMRRYIRDPK